MYYFGDGYWQLTHMNDEFLQGLSDDGLTMSTDTYEKGYRQIGEIDYMTAFDGG